MLRSGATADRGRGSAFVRRVGRTNASSRLLDPKAWLARCLAREIEERRPFAWLAVAFGLGIVLFFPADGPPSMWPPLLVAICLAAWAARSGHRPLVMPMLVGMVAVCLGFSAAALRTSLVDAPVLARMTIGAIEGFVESVEERTSGGRLVLRVSLVDKAVGTAPERVRVSLRDLAGIQPGDYVRGTARLLPPPEEARPGGYDFARDAFYKGIGAVGSFSGKATVVAPPPRPPDLSLRVAAAIDRARNALTTRIASAIGGQAGAVAAALITGKRGLIDETTNAALRGAGIYHVVSISGLHMVLAAGTFFWLARALLAALPGLALLWPIKKIAALVGMAGATAYCVFSGSEVATERSLLMILVMQGAILFDRPALSIRNLAISALVVLAREPETLLGPSLQMSYAAVGGLIAMAELLRRRKPPEGGTGWVARGLRWIAAAILGVIGTTLVATLATAPFSTFHFQSLNPYGIIGNAATLPLISLAVMPAAVLGVVAYPFGLDRPVWWAMGQAVQGVIALSTWVSGFEGASLVVPAFGAGALSLFVLAILIATLCASSLRVIALAPAAAGLVLAASPVRPDAYVARDGSGAALRGGDGRLVLVGRVADFTAEQWLRADGDGRRPADAKTGASCDTIGCVVRMKDGTAAAFVADRRAFPEDCVRARLVISRLPAPPACAAKLVVDRDFLAARGATAIRMEPEGFVTETARRPGEKRVWQRSSIGPAKPQAAPAASQPGSPASPPAEPEAGTPPADDDGFVP